MGIREVQERVSERIEKVPGRYVDGTVKASRVAERGRQRAIENSVVSELLLLGKSISVVVSALAFSSTLEEMGRGHVRFYINWVIDKSVHMVRGLRM